MSEPWLLLRCSVAEHGMVALICSGHMSGGTCEHVNMVYLSCWCMAGGLHSRTQAAAARREGGGCGCSASGRGDDGRGAHAAGPHAGRIPLPHAPLLPLPCRRCAFLKGLLNIPQHWRRRICASGCLLFFFQGAARLLPAQASPAWTQQECWCLFTLHFSVNKTSTDITNCVDEHRSHAGAESQGWGMSNLSC